MFGHGNIWFRIKILEATDKAHRAAYENIMRLLETHSKEIELLRANQNSDINDWWVEKHGCWLRSCLYVERGYLPRSSDDHRKLPWKYRTPDTLEWKDVGPDLSEAIKEIEENDG